MSKGKTTKSYDYTYSSYSGCDIVASITIPTFNTKPLVIGELQTVSYSIHREVVPIRTLGRANPKGFTSGTRTVAGSLIFTVFDTNLVHKIVDLINSSYNSVPDIEKTSNSFDKYKDRIKDIENFSVMDEMPPFDITISFSNEYGNNSVLVIKGIIIVDEGQVMSVEDMITENTMSYMATDIQVLKSNGQLNPSVSTIETERSDTLLKGIQLSAGQLTSEFDPVNMEYTAHISKEIIIVPSIVATPRSSSSEVSITYPSKIPGTIKIKVTGKDNSFSMYYIYLKQVTGDVALNNLLVDGVSVAGFTPDNTFYSVTLSYNIKSIPKVTGIPNDITGAHVNIERTFTLPGTTKAIVMADNGTKRTYYVSFGVLPPAANANLASIATGSGILVPSFNPSIINYELVLPYDTIVLPSINGRADDFNANLQVVQSTAIDSAGTITVTAENGTTLKTYTVSYKIDLIPFTTVFNNAFIAGNVTFSCRIGEMAGSDAIAFDSYTDVNYDRAVYLEDTDTVVLNTSSGYAVVTGVYQGYFESPTYGFIKKVRVTSIDYV